VYYLNIPRKFIAGTVYDPAVKEIIEGARCTLSDVNGKDYSALTDGFGDFWFEKLEAGLYSLKIEAPGFKAKTLDNLDTEKDINLGDIPMAK
jgi:hypothetical protein